MPAMMAPATTTMGIATAIAVLPEVLSPPEPVCVDAAAVDDVIGADLVLAVAPITVVPCNEVIGVLVTTMTVVLGCGLPATPGVVAWVGFAVTTLVMSCVLAGCVGAVT